MNSREDLFSSPSWLFRLFRPAEAVDAILGAVETRGPGSAVIVPNAPSSHAALADVYELLEAGRGDEREGPKVLFVFGDGGALAMRMTGAAAASSGCKNGLCVSFSKCGCVP